MNRDQASNLIQQTFTQAFDKTRFRTFAINLLNHVNEEKAFNRNRQYIKAAFNDHVNRFERMGEYVAPNGQRLDVLIVHLATEAKLERARTALRNFVADHLKDRNDKDAALVAFVSPSEATWRFSYVKMEYASVERAPGEVGVETHLTPARRFSYLVGEGENCHTAQSRFLALLQDTQTDPPLSTLEEAFSVEAVTKEFFNQYRKLFEDIHAALEKLIGKNPVLGEEFKARNISAVDFSKKLMGQIVFLYFLQKKGWLGVEQGKDWGTGPRDFLRKVTRTFLLEHPNGNLFNDVFEPLFYDTLATDRGHDAWCNRFKCRIPFLNGGLFEPLGGYNWKQTDIILPNTLFTSVEAASPPLIPQEDTPGTGVLDVFDRYNFTVNEAEPLEKEVAIDPEMLGKVFENLIEDNRRKGLGAFYTPREIVHYMCQESLINYLDTALNVEAASPPLVSKQISGGDAASTSTIVPRADIETFIHLGEQISHYVSVETKYPIKMPESIKRHARLIDEKLADMTVCDPAVGSGAFPVGMMTEIVRARSALTHYFVAVEAESPPLSCFEEASGEDAASTFLHYFDPELPIGEVHGGNLPHWRQEGATYFVTFRTADSMPAERVEQWKAERAVWLKQHPEPHDAAVRREYHKLFHERWQNWLDESHGACHLANPEIKRLVENALRHFDGDRYRLDEFVVMPNHVHALITPLGEHALSEILQNWKSFTAHEINKRLNLAGAFWQKESFDHIVRSADQAERIRQYIRDNPKKSVEAASPPLIAEVETASPPLAPNVEAMSPSLASKQTSGGDAASTLTRTPYHFKRHAIQNCLYGVDIDPSAVEIAKLRLWLSLVVDEEDVKQIKPLPNLDYKIVEGNSLLGVEKDLFNDELFKRLETLKPLYFDETDKDKKDRYKLQIEETIHELTKVEAMSSSLASSHQKSGGNAVSTFDFEIYFSEVFHRKGGFDVVIANPPYVRQEKIKELKPALKVAGYECFNGTADLLVYFYERGVKLLRGDGAIALITSNKYYRAGYGKALRRFLARELTLHRLIDFGDAPVFEAIAYASILIGTRNVPPGDATALCYTWEQGASFSRIAQTVTERGQKISQSELKPDGWRLESPAVLRLLEKLRHAGKPLGEYVNGRFYRGIVTGLNEAFVVDRATRNRLIREHKSSAEILKPLLRGRDVKRWRVEFADQYLIRIESSENKQHPWSGKAEEEAEKIFAKAFPAIHAHFENLRDELIRRDDQGKYFWELRSCTYWQEFEQTKIVFPDIAQKSEFTWDSHAHYLLNTSYVLPTTEKWLLGVLNSNLVFWFYIKISNTIRGGFVRFIRQYVESIPIPSASPEKQKTVECLVDRILAAKQRDAEADTSAWEREIDRLVYALYGLTPEEIKIVEGERT